MFNLYSGILVIVLCLIGYLFAWKMSINERTRLSVFLLIICGLLLRVFVASDLYLHEWDERYHALVAKNLIEHPFVPTLYDNPVLSYDYTNWSGNHIWLHKQPLPLWCMALSMWIFGINEIALRLPSIVLSTIGIGLTFSIATYFFNNKVGFIAAFLFSIHGLIIELSGGRVPTDHIDVFFLFFVELAVYFGILCIKKKNLLYNVLSGISVGAAILCKWFPALIVLPIFFLLFIESKRFSAKEIIFHVILLLTVTCLIFLPWQIYIHRVFPLEAQWENKYNIRHFTETLQDMGGPFYYHFDKVRIIFGELIYIPLIWFIWKSGKNWRKFKRLAIITWFVIPYIFFSVAKTKMSAYILFTAPAIFIITAIFFHYLYVYRNRFRYKWIIYLVLILLVGLPARYSIERTKPFQIRERNPLWAIELRELNRIQEENVLVFNMDHAIEAMFYTDFTVYPTLPQLQTLKELSDKGYTIIINDKGSLNTEYSKEDWIKIIKLTSYNQETNF